MIAGAIRRPLAGAGPMVLAAGALAWLALIIGAPLATVFGEALAKGLGPFLDAFKDPDCQAAIRLTLLVAAIAVPLNATFGLAAAWSIARFDFRGRSLLMTLIDLPLSLSPVISGLVWVLLFGARGWFGPELDAAGIKIIFALPGIVLGTILVTVPLVARELIPLMVEQGADEELAAVAMALDMVDARRTRSEPVEVSKWKSSLRAGSLNPRREWRSRG